MKSLQGWGTRTAVGVATVALAGAVACSDGFSDDCQVGHTCPEADETPGGADAMGEPANGGDGDGSSALGGAGSAQPGAAGSGEVPADCQASADCSNDDPADGEETCFNGKCAPGNPPPTVVSVTPEDEAVSVEPDGTVVIELSEALDEDTVTDANVRILDGGEPVPGKLGYADNEITFEPEKPLGLLVSYEVSVSPAVTDVEGAGLAEAFSSKFSVRDGDWSAVTVVPGAITEMSPTLQLNADGDALLAWIGEGAGTCPATAQWFNRGTSLASAKTLSFGLTQYCRTVRAAASGSGLALVSWYEEDSQGNAMATAEFRDGKWGSVTARNERYDSLGAVAVGDDGVMHFFAADDSDVSVWQTTTEGAWSQEGQELAPLVAQADPKVAVAKNGDALATWRAKENDGRQKIVVASYSSTSAAWGTAITLPGSLATGSGAGMERGEPQVAFDEANAPVVIWQRADEIVASRYLKVQSAWSGPEPISGDITGFSVLGYSPEPPALVFDGRTFVVAFTALEATNYNAYVVRYDRDNDVWGEPELVSDASSNGTPRMPRLTADAHGNLIALWASLKSAGVYNLIVQRYAAAAGTWSGPAPITGVSIKNVDLPTGVGRYALGGNQAGLAAVAFSDVDSAGQPLKLQLASFH